MLHAASILKGKGTLRVFNMAPTFIEEITSSVYDHELQNILHIMLLHISVFCIDLLGTLQEVCIFSIMNK